MHIGPIDQLEKNNKTFREKVEDRNASDPIEGVMIRGRQGKGEGREGKGKRSLHLRWGRGHS